MSIEKTVFVIKENSYFWLVTKAKNQQCNLYAVIKKNCYRYRFL